MTATATDSRLWDFVKAFVSCSSYVALNAGLIFSSQHLVHLERFPYPAVLTTFQVGGSWLLCCLLLQVMPSMFPAMGGTHGQQRKLLSWFAPVGIFFAVSLYCSNWAFLHCGVAFLQFMKEANVVIAFGLACLVGNQALTRQRFLLAAWIIAGAWIALRSELRFPMLGFVIQASSQLAESTKGVMGEFMLKQREWRLDPLTYMMFIAPSCLLALLVAIALTWSAEIPSKVAEWWPQLLMNTLVAFALNLSIASLMKECSITTTLISGLVKAMLIVAIAIVLLGEHAFPQQVFGFGITLAGTFFWSYMTIAPDSRAVMLLNRAVCATKESLGASENTPLVGGEQP